MLHQWLIIALAFTVLSFPTAAQVVAKVGSKAITLQDFKKKYNEVKRQTINPPTPEVFLEDLIRYELGIQEAKKKGLENDPIFKERLNQELYKVNLEKVLGKKVSKIKVNEREMRRYLRSNPPLRLRHILIEIKPGASAKERAIAKKRAHDIYKEIKKIKRPFEDWAKLYSDDTFSKENGGDIGFQSKVTLAPPVYDIAKKMKKGKISKPIATRHGLHIIKLIAKGTYNDANKRQLRAAVFDNKRKALFDGYFKPLKKKYKITISKHVLKKLK